MFSDIPQGNTHEGNLLADERFLRKIAYMYYEDGHSQETIAELEFCSRQTVSKALQRARERGIIRTTIIPDIREGYLRNLTREIRQKLNLQDLLLVPGGNFENIGPDEVIDEVVNEMGKAAADYLDQLLSPEDVLAVSGGKRFMRNVVRYLKPERPLPRLRVVSTLGFVEPRTSPGDANLVAYDVAKAYGASHTWYCIPAFMPRAPGVSSEAVMKMNANLSITAEAMNLCDQANVFMMGLWTPHTNDEVVKRGILSKEQLEVFESRQPVVDINHWVFDAEGHCINDLLASPPYHLTGFRIPDLKEKIQKENLKVILVAGGGPSYIPAIRAALKAGLANILVTDHITAQLLPD